MLLHMWIILIKLHDIYMTEPFFLTKRSKHCGGVGNIVITSSAYMNMFERVRNLECKMIHELPSYNIGKAVSI